MHQAVKEKISNMASAAKEHITICKAKMDEKVEKSAARTKEQKDIGKERRKAKEAQAKMELHEAKANHAAEKLYYRQKHHLPTHHEPLPVGAQYGNAAEPPVIRTYPVDPAVPMTGAAAPTHYPGHKFI